MTLQHCRPAVCFCFVFVTGLVASVANAQFVYNGHIYNVTPSYGSWTDAEAYAVSQGAHLVTIDDADENEFIRTNFLNSGGQEDFWIGLYSPDGPANDPSTYVWASGSKSSYRNFRPGQPDLGSGVDFYVAINFLLNNDGRWDNYPNTGFREIRGIYEEVLGDVNCDGEVNLLDVGPFVEAISSGEYNAKADVNQDAVVNLLDVDPFIAILGGG